MKKLTFLTVCARADRLCRSGGGSASAVARQLAPVARPRSQRHRPAAIRPLTWDEKTNIKWKAALPGRGSATPIVWGDQVFVVTAIKTDRVADPKDLPKPDPPLRDEDHAADELLPVRRPQLRPRHRQAALEADRRREGAARGTSSDALLRRRFADHRRPAPLRLVRLVRHLLLRPRRQAALAARPGPAAHAPRLGRGRHAGDPRRFAAAQLGPGSGLRPLSASTPGPARRSGRPTATRRRRGTRRWSSSTRAARRSSSTARTGSAVTTWRRARKSGSAAA